MFTCNETYYSNDKETCNFMEEILQSYVSNIIKVTTYHSASKTLVTMGVFKGQVTPMMLSFCKECNIEVMCVPPKMTHVLNSELVCEKVRLWNIWYLLLFRDRESIERGNKVTLH